MKKLLFVCYGLGIGGIEKCLVNLVNALPENQFDIDILLMNPEYDLKDQIRRKVSFIDRFDYVMNTTDTMDEIAEHGGILKNVGKFFRYCLFRLSVKFGKEPWKLFKDIGKKYDVAVAYSHHDYSKYFVIEKVVAKKKFLFYHDGIYKLDDSQKIRDHYYFPKFDNIIAVSKCTRDMLVSIYPEIDKKTIVVYNIINDSEIISKAREFTPKKENRFTIVTVGRLVDQKQPEVAVQIARRLKDSSYQFVWKWVGDGPRCQKIKDLIEQNDLMDIFVLLGNQVNPYPYINCADLYVQPSRDEAYCTTTNEARILHKVIVTTDCSGMDEQVVNGVTGIITKNKIEEMYSAIERLICSPELLKEFENNIPLYLPVFSDYIKQYYSLFY